MSSILAKTPKNPEITIRFKNINKQLSANIKLSFIYASNSHSFADDYPLDTLAFRETLTKNTDIKRTVHLLPPYEMLSQKWILKAEISLEEDKQVGEVITNSTVFSHTFYHEISFEKKCRGMGCIENYEVTYEKAPTWSQDTDDPINFHFQLTNKGDFLTHLIIDATMSMDCKITISDPGFTATLKSNTLSLSDMKSRARFMYNKVTSPDGTFPFTVQALCPQVMNRTSGPVLKLSIKSFLPYDLKEINITAAVTRKTELMIFAKILSSVSKRVCRDSEVEENVNFNVELFVECNHEGDLPLAAILYSDNMGYTRVVSVNIKSNEPQVVKDVGLLQNQHGKATQMFSIRKNEKVKIIQLSISYKILIKALKSIPLILEVVPVIDDPSKYSLNSIVANKAEYHYVINIKYCKNQLLVMIFAALGYFFLIICCSYMVFHMVTQKLIRPFAVLKYIVDNKNGPANI
ncbi:hypothetical protein RF11_10652 [Thelohanellus kitauei]|uniref:Uncharacterized protein n=1 Tax=Thelohanellus kitauei TaxID=669202 RepID=A0A0C2J2H3_THEKT|nr:hypothetical protein RF11_10652 [Thelohanellus kitauei]